jgi:hypothetical protein
MSFLSLFAEKVSAIIEQALIAKKSRRIELAVVRGEDKKREMTLKQASRCREGIEERGGRCTTGYAITQRTPCGAVGEGRQEDEGYAIAQRTPRS